MFLLPEELVERLVFLKAVDIRLERRKKISRTIRLFEKNWLSLSSSRKEATEFIAYDYILSNFCWSIANYVAAIVKEDGCHVRVKEGCWCSICSPLTLSKKEATMVGCWWQPTTII
jgi:hypothetical protein